MGLRLCFPTELAELAELADAPMAGTTSETAPVTPPIRTASRGLRAAAARRADSGHAERLDLIGK